MRDLRQTAAHLGARCVREEAARRGPGSPRMPAPLLSPPRGEAWALGAGQNGHLTYAAAARADRRTAANLSVTAVRSVAATLLPNVPAERASDFHAARGLTSPQTACLSAG